MNRIKNIYISLSLLFFAVYFLLPVAMNTRHEVTIINESQKDISAVVEVYSGDYPGSHVAGISGVGILSPGESKKGSFSLYELGPETCTAIHILDLKGSLIKKFDCDLDEIVFSGN